MVAVGAWLRRQGGPTRSALVLPTLAVHGKTWLDGETPYVHRLVSYLSALRESRTEAEWRTYCAWAVATGFTGLRTFGGFREDQTPEGALANLPRYLEVATEYHLVVEFTALTGTADHPYDPEQYIADAAAIMRPYKRHVVLELANEYEHGSQDLHYEDLQRWGETHCADLLWAVGAPPEDEPTPEGVWHGEGGTYGTAHLDRGRDFWNQCRRVREIYACTDASGTPVLDNEPLGADELDGSVTGKQRSNDPAFFACLGALDRGFPGVGGCHHNQAGLDAVLPGPVQQRCAEAYVAAGRAVDAILGTAVPQYKNAGHADSPVVTMTGAVREYSFTAGNVGATIGVGEEDGATISWGNGWAPEATVYECRATNASGRLVVRRVRR